MAIPITDELHLKTRRAVYLRLPWLVLGLLVGLGISFFVSAYEKVLSENISLVFFLPLIVYMSDAVGTQTETMYVRSLAKGKVHFLKHLSKEFLIGLIMGVFLGVLVGLSAWLWLGSWPMALVVGLAMFLNVTLSPILALIIPQILFREHTDPALGAGPMTTAIQDGLSLLIYFLTAAVVLTFFIPQP